MAKQLANQQPAPSLPYWVIQHQLDALEAAEVNLFIYLVTRSHSVGYDEYSSFVCIASSEKEASSTPPCRLEATSNLHRYGDEGPQGWIDAHVSCIGQAHPGQSPGVIHSSYCAG